MTLRKLVNFIQYNNFFIFFVVAIIMGGSAAFAASPDLRKDVLDKNLIIRSVDNTYIINTNLDTFDNGLMVTNVTEDETTFYIDYTYNTVEVTDFVWKEVTKSGTMRVLKVELGGRDLGLYVGTQLSQMITEQITYLKESQKNEKKNGVSQKVVATEYSGLVGQFLKPKEQVFEGYRPVKKAIQVTDISSVSTDPNNSVMQVTGGTTNHSSGKGPLSLDEIQKIVQESIIQILSRENNTTATSSEGGYSVNAATETALTNNSSNNPVTVSSNSNSTITNVVATTSPSVSADVSTSSVRNIPSSNTATSTEESSTATTINSVIPITSVVSETSSASTDIPQAQPVETPPTVESVLVVPETSQAIEDTVISPIATP